MQIIENLFIKTQKEGLKWRKCPNISCFIHCIHWVGVSTPLCVFKNPLQQQKGWGLKFYVGGLTIFFFGVIADFG